MNTIPELSQKDLRHNLILNCIHELTWSFGLAFHTVYAIIPLFLKQLGAPQGIVTSVAGLFTILIAIPQFMAAVWGRNIQNVKAAVIGVHTLIWPPAFMIGFTFTFFGPTGTFAWIFYYICFILYGLGVGIIIPIWAGFLHHATNEQTRGNFFGISFAFGSLGGFIGGFIVKALLSSSIPFPINFGWGFFILLISIIVGTLTFVGYRINSPEDIQPHRTVAQFWSETKEIIRTHRNFRRYLFARIFFTANFPVLSLYAVYTQGKFGFDISEAGIFTVLNVVAFGFSSYLAGKIGDRFGHKTAITLAFCAFLVAVLFALLARTMVGVYCIFIFIGAGQGAFLPSSMNLVYKFAGNRDNKLYMAMIDTFLAPFIFLAIMIAGSLTGIVAVEWIFIGSAVFLIIGLFLMIRFVKDPQYTSQEPVVNLPG